MSLILVLPSSPCSPNRLPPRVNNVHMMSNRIPCDSQSSGITPCSSYFNTEHDGVYTQRVEELKNHVRHLILQTYNRSEAGVELINDLQRLGVGYLFEEEIRTVLDAICMAKDIEIEKDLYATALHFRILRQNGYYASKDAFSRFTDEMGSFKACLCEDTKGLLSLYEASYLAFPGETIMDEAKAFTRRHLDNLNSKIDPRLSEQVAHALELPMHYRMPRLEARWYIDMYEKEVHTDPLVLELAKLDYNILQASYQRELQTLYRWWRQMGMVEKLPFIRDRLLGCYLFALSLTFKPQFGYGREVLTRCTQMITTIDDMYDIYGSVEELELFTDSVERWDTNAIQQVPEYMRLCFLALLNFGNDLGYDTLKEQGWDIIPYLRKVWADLCKAELVEARWYQNGYTPTLEEYLSNGWISVSGPAALIHSYFTMRLKVTEKVLQAIENYGDLIHFSSIIFRLCDDMGTSTDELKRGDVPKSIQCYMNESNASEADSQKHIRGLIDETWKKMNKEYVIGSLFPQPLADAIIGLARSVETAYLKGDEFGAPNSEMNGHAKSLLVKPIPITKI
ncbi:Alpha-terpineol synthase, chloroplastic [Cinnamomum micranthum f. kanehirae]|uniref:Alpha-terpineol synthase, chloroplastic n=1 Tax=Cinnamomum micranthum f. kanehirae TaxID=337451 RepID=A0A3S4NYW5_9MAGN|nr:Alpha-terpineol synthase, chloroplastic [Cinnamomum micranthum f. kanehirae]